MSSYAEDIEHSRLDWATLDSIYLTWGWLDLTSCTGLSHTGWTELK